MKKLHVTMVAVLSVNGKITKGQDSDIYKWTSKEDAKFFAGLIAKHNLIVMGRKTYEIIRSYVKHQPDKLRVIMTSQPQHFDKETIKGSLEFTNESPRQLVERLTKQGYSEMLLGGGGKINAAFLDAGLVDELYLTIEPVIFGQGTDLITSSLLNVSLDLVELTKLNKQGTILARYKVGVSSAKDNQE
ncbi:MAG: dihydrofolate reductase family protein [bacterium]|nr:dihydrofolate reductase family protein [bacterium]